MHVEKGGTHEASSDDRLARCDVCWPHHCAFHGDGEQGRHRALSPRRATAGPGGPGVAAGELVVALPSELYVRRRPRKALDLAWA